MTAAVHSCSNCERINCFGFNNLLVPKNDFEHCSPIDTCGLMHGEQFLAQIMGCFWETMSPVTVVQMKHADCILGDEFQKFEWPYEDETYVNPYKPVCRIIRKNCGSAHCENCTIYGERVAKLILNTTYCADIEGRIYKLRESCNKDNESVSPNLNIEVKTTKEREHPDRIYLVYKCPITKFTEIAIPFAFNQKYRLVLFFGQHFMHEDHHEINAALDRFFRNAAKMGINTKSDEYTQFEKSRSEIVKRERKGEQIAGVITRDELQRRVAALFTCLEEVKSLMDDLLIAKTHKQMDAILMKAYKEFKDNYTSSPIKEGSYYNDATERLNNLIDAANKGTDVLSDGMKVKITLFLPSAVRIQDSDAIVLAPHQTNGEKLESIIVSNNQITKGNGYKSKGDDKHMFRVFPYNESENEEIFVKSEFPVACLVGFEGAPDVWFDKDGKPHKPIRAALAMILNAFSQHVRAEGIEIQSAFNAMRIQQFSSILRHEIGQKTTMMQNRYTQYLHYLNDYYKKRVTDINSPDWAWYGDGIDPFKQNLRTFINNTMAHVHLVSVMSNTGRYLKGTPEPVKTWFKPYGDILFKWRDMFESSCADAYLHCPFPGLDKIRASEGRWSDFPDMYADIGQIEQVAYNLTTNAIKYSLRYTSFTIDCRVSENGAYYELVVTNYSRPIAEDDQEEIFKYNGRAKDSKAENSPKLKEKEGDGLGLYISRQIAEKHKGALTISGEAAKPICNYNIPLLLLLHALPEEWQPGGKMATGDGKDSARRVHLEQEYKKWSDRSNKQNRKKIEEIVHPDIIKILDGTMTLDEFIKKWAKTKEDETSFKLLRYKWLISFYSELQKPTAKIVMTMEIPL